MPVRSTANLLCTTRSMTPVLLSLVLAATPVASAFTVPALPDSGPRATAATAATAATPAVAAGDSAAALIGPRLRPIGISHVGAALDSTGSRAPRPRAIEYSDAYYQRLTIHRIASYTELPLFAAEYALGQHLLHDERTGYPPSWLKTSHTAVAGGLGVLFAVNTITGGWNLWDSRAEPSGRALRIAHSLAMLGADAGFAWAGASGSSANASLQNTRHHRAIAVGSMALATAGTAMMWLFHD